MAPRLRHGRRPGLRRGDRDPRQPRRTPPRHRRYLYADDFDARPIGTAGATAAGWNGLGRRRSAASPTRRATRTGSGARTPPRSTGGPRSATPSPSPSLRLPDTVTARIAVETKYWLYVNDELVVFEGSVKRGPKKETPTSTVDLGPTCATGETPSRSSPCPTARRLRRSLLRKRRALPRVPRPRPEHRRHLEGPQPRRLPLDGGPPQLPPRRAERRYDARTELAGWAGWQGAGFDDSAWPAAITAGNEGSSPSKTLVDPHPAAEVRPGHTCRSPTRGSRDQQRWRDDVRVPCRSTTSSPVGAAPRLHRGRSHHRLKTDHAKVKGSGTEQAVQAEYVTRAGEQDYESLVWMNGDKLVVTAPAREPRCRRSATGCPATTRSSTARSRPTTPTDKLWTMSRDTLYVTMRDSYMDCPTASARSGGAMRPTRSRRRSTPSTRRPPRSVARASAT